jgi:hypothetical protein
MSRYSAEEKAARIAEARDLLADLDVADALRAASSSHAMPEPSAMQSFGLLPLLSSARSERFRAEALELEQRHAAERAERKRQEEHLMTGKTQADASWNEWADRKIAAALEGHGFNEMQTDTLGQALAEERKLMRDEIAAAVGALRAELAKTRGVGEGAIIDLPRKRDPHAA